MKEMITAITVGPVEAGSLQLLSVYCSPSAFLSSPGWCPCYYVSHVPKGKTEAWGAQGTSKGQRAMLTSMSYPKLGLFPQTSPSLGVLGYSVSTLHCQIISKPLRLSFWQNSYKTLGLFCLFVWLVCLCGGRGLGIMESLMVCIWDTTIWGACGKKACSERIWQLLLWLLRHFKLGFCFFLVIKNGQLRKPWRLLEEWKVWKGPCVRIKMPQIGSLDNCPWQPVGCVTNNWQGMRLKNKHILKNGRHVDFS